VEFLEYEVISGGILREKYRCVRQSYVEIAIVRMLWFYCLVLLLLPGRIPALLSLPTLFQLSYSGFLHSPPPVILPHVRVVPTGVSGTKEDIRGLPQQLTLDGRRRHSCGGPGKTGVAVEEQRVSFVCELDISLYIDRAGAPRLTWASLNPLGLVITLLQGCIRVLNFFKIKN